MKIKTEDGQEFELVGLHGAVTGPAFGDTYALKPLKTEKKERFRLAFYQMFSYKNSTPPLISEEFDLAESQAQKLSEAISAVVEYIQSPLPRPNLVNIAEEARKAMRGE